ncbi:MAG: hypothetical protein LBR37_00065 [Erysipelotrichaceae bacterium]|jgi:thiamine biosynthesis protein ThiI|nr:hypothetical protein [Erysipelotrichaceae bacterium]
MKPEKIMIRYGELMTKGHNKQGFLMRLHLDIKTRLKELKDLTYERTHDQFFIVLHGIEVSLVTAVLKKIPGIH